MNPEGIGFGNLSLRIKGTNSFFITGSATGGIPHASINHYTKVASVNFKRNSLSCVGAIKASSESLTHAAVYSCVPSCAAVFHVHNTALWNYLLKKHPSTSKSAAYGTLEMAQEVFRLFKETGVSQTKIFAMGGHEDGVMAFGSSLEEVGQVLLKYFSLVSK